MDKSFGSFLHFVGVFNSHMLNPYHRPQAKLDACIQNFFLVWTARKFRNDALFLGGNPEMTEKYEYSIAVPRTFVHDCGFEFGIRFNCSIKMHL